MTSLDGGQDSDITAGWCMKEEFKSFKILFRQWSSSGMWHKKVLMKQILQHSVNRYGSVPYS